MYERENPSYKVWQCILVITKVGPADAWVAWKEGVNERIAFRLIAGFVIAAWGFFGMHAGL